VDKIDSFLFELPETGACNEDSMALVMSLDVPRRFT
jgi:hypothetical protein